MTQPCSILDGTCPSLGLTSKLAKKGIATPYFLSRKLLGLDAVYVTIIREPSECFASTFDYRAYDYKGHFKVGFQDYVMG